MEATSGTLDTLLSLPKGAGAPGGMGERFQADTLKGTGSYAIPLPVPAGPNGFRPELSLRYSTGAADGPFGIGWALVGPMSIARRLDRAAPRYSDEDEFVLGGSELLVPTGDGRYRPRTERAFFHLERQGEGWRLRSTVGRTTVVGQSEAGQLRNAGRVLAWYAERDIDQAGNEIQWSYVFDAGHAYLARVSWSIYSLELVYEDRPDPSTSGRAGFERTLRRRCVAIERRCSRLAQPVLGRHQFHYRQDDITRATLLERITQTGIGDDGETEDAAPISFEYSRFSPRASVHQLTTGSAPRLGAGVALADLDGDGRPEIVDTRRGRHRVWSNRGDGSFGPPRGLAVAPAGLDLTQSGTTFADIDGDGAIDIVRVAPDRVHAYRNNGAGGWDARPAVVRTTTRFSPGGTGIRFADLDGDGMTDVLASGGVVAIAREGVGWDRMRTLTADPADPPPTDLRRGDLHLADMTGDGLTDIVLVNSGRIEVWPSLGSLRFGSRIRMRNAPQFPPRMDPRRLFVVDVNRDGCADLVMIDEDGATIWINRQGKSWSPATRLRFPGPRRSENVELTDLFGTGALGAMWGQRYVSLGSGRAHLLAQIDHGTGVITKVEHDVYVPSGEATEHLPFPLHVVTRIVRTDAITGDIGETRLEYREAAYDGLEREFRGFAKVSIESRPGLGIDWIRQEIEHFLGETRPGEMRAMPPSERARQRALTGAVMANRIYSLAASSLPRLLDSTAIEWLVREDTPGVHSVLPKRIEQRDHTEGQRDRVSRTEYQHDEFGNVIERIEHRYLEGDAPQAMAQRVTYVREPERWLVGLPARIESRDGDGALLSDVIHYYDGVAFHGEALGHATHGILRRTEELALAFADLPPGYAEEIDAAWGYRADAQGYYRTTFAAEHDAVGNAARMRDALGRETVFAYDADRLFPSVAERPDGTRTEIDFDPRSGQPRVARLPNGATHRYRFSPLGQLRSQEELDENGSFQALTAFRADLSDGTRPARMMAYRARQRGLSVQTLLASSDDTTGVDIAVEYFDGSGQRLAAVRTAGSGPAPRYIASLRREYAGDLPRADLPDCEWPSLDYLPPTAGEPRTTFAYDGLRRVINTALPDGRSVRIEGGTERVRRTRLASHGNTATARVDHLDAKGMVTHVELPEGDGTRIRATLDAQGRPMVLFDATGAESTRYVYATFGPPIQIVHHQGGKRRYWFDAAGALRRRRNGDGTTIELFYDAGGHLVRVEKTEAGSPIEVLRRFEYQDGRLIVGVDGTVELRMAYDVAGRLRSATWRAPGMTVMTVGYEYDLQGNGTAVIYPDGTRVATDRGWGGDPGAMPGIIDAVELDPHGYARRLVVHGGAEIQQAYDPVTRWLRRAEFRTASGTIRATSWEHDEAGQISAIVDELEGRTLRREFDYDAVGRLSGATMIDGSMRSHIDYSYSLTGDLIAGEYPAVTDIVYDATGQVTSLAGASLRWDVWGRLVEATEPSGVSTRWQYDINGNRVRREVLNSAGTHVTDYAGSVFERGADYQRLYLFLGTSPIGCQIKRGSDTRTIVAMTDPHGSPLVCIDPMGSTVSQQIYSPYGTPLSLTSAPSPEFARWLGREADPVSGLVHLGRRVYSPLVGRFLGPDWYVIETPQRTLEVPEALNAYAYALNNPLLYRDPTGAWFGADDAVVAAIGFAVGFTIGAIAAHKNGDSWLMGGLEGGLLGAAGAWLGYNTGGIVFKALGWSPGWLLGKAGVHVCVSGKALAYAGAAIGAINGGISGGRHIYNFGSYTGWLAFGSDSTWSLTGTGLGLFTHLTAISGGGYRDNLSRRQNRHVYSNGIGYKNFAHTQGNVTTNYSRPVGHSLNDHEGLHAFQSRLAGPLYQLTYVTWFVVGGIIGLGIGLFTQQSLGDDFLDMGYFNNPWEMWAYEKGGTRNGGTLQW